MLKVFVSYASEDKERVRPYFEKLREAGFDAWMDVLLLPGQRWEVEIERNLQQANVVLIFVSSNSVHKRGFVQREANTAVANLRYKKPDDIYLIPLLIEECEIPDSITQVAHYGKLYEDGTWTSVVAALRIAAAQQQIELKEGVTHGPFRVYESLAISADNGRPKFDIRIQYPRFESERFPSIADEVSKWTEGNAYRSLLTERVKPWARGRSSKPTDCGIPADEFDIGNSFWESFIIHHASDRILSWYSVIGTYYAGAAHGNTTFSSRNYFIGDHAYPFELIDLFSDVDAALKIISEFCIKDLTRQMWESSGHRIDNYGMEWLTEGASPVPGNFSSFVTNETSLTILFPPYAVAAYAYGTFEVAVPLYILLDLISPIGPLGHLLVRAV